ncbi:MAG: hypothetical protein KDD45_06665, partial [Bdellovibrionales bacterium]|nr:hypothetical protein [Bdellovibrionales bacterium]
MYRSRSIRVLLTGFLLALPSLGASQNNFQCLKSYINPNELSKTLDTSFIDQFISQTNPKNKWVTVSDQVRIEDQGYRGFCHIYSLKEELSREFKLRNGKDPEVSLHYIGYKFWLQRALETASKPFSSLDVQEGGWYVNTFQFIKSVGVMTEKQWAEIGGRTDMEKPARNYLETEQLKKVIYDAHNNFSRVITLLAPEILSSEIKSQIGIDLKLDLSKPSDRSKYYMKLFADDNNIQNLRRWILLKKVQLKDKSTHMTKEDLDFLMEASKGNFHNMKEQNIASIFNHIQMDTKD